MMVHGWQADARWRQRRMMGKSEMEGEGDGDGDRMDGRHIINNHPHELERGELRYVYMMD